MGTEGYPFLYRRLTLVASVFHEVTLAVAALSSQGAAGQLPPDHGANHLRHNHANDFWNNSRGYPRCVYREWRRQNQRQPIAFEK
jgi:hypothetical protein